MLTLSGINLPPRSRSASHHVSSTIQLPLPCFASHRKSSQRNSPCPRIHRGINSSPKVLLCFLSHGPKSQLVSALLHLLQQEQMCDSPHPLIHSLSSSSVLILCLSAIWLASHFAILGQRPSRLLFYSEKNLCQFHLARCLALPTSPQTERSNILVVVWSSSLTRQNGLKLSDQIRSHERAQAQSQGV